MKINIANIWECVTNALISTQKEQRFYSPLAGQPLLQLQVATVIAREMQKGVKPAPVWTLVSYLQIPSPKEKFLSCLLYGLQKVISMAIFDCQRRV